MLGTRKNAEAEFARLIYEANSGVRVDPVKITLGEWLRNWLDSRTPDLAPMSVQRYRDIIERQTIPVLGGIVLQKLKPLHIRNWMTDMRDHGGRYGRPLSARSVGHAYRCLSAALQAAVKLELLARNPAASEESPAAKQSEVRILEPAEITAVCEALKGNRIFYIVGLALATGMRRGELLAFRWSDIDLDKREIKVERSLEETRAGGLRLKKPKNNRLRTIPIGGKSVAVLRP